MGICSRATTRKVVYTYILGVQTSTKARSSEDERRNVVDDRKFGLRKDLGFTTPGDKAFARSMPLPFQLPLDIHDFA